MGRSEFVEREFATNDSMPKPKRTNSARINRRRMMRTAALSAACLPFSGLSSVFNASTKRLIVILVMDGLDPRYLDKSDMPNLRRMMRQGVYLNVSGVIPSVTNVNNTSIVTGSFPKSHGITANYYYDRKSGKEFYMETPDFVLQPTLFEKARALGYWTALLSSKEKIRRLLSKGADLAISAPNPSKELVKGIGKSAGMYTPDVNYWLFRSLQWILKSRKNKDEKQLIYVATTDYMMHTYAPGEERSQIHLRTLDEMLGQIVNEHPNIELYLTADHGMNAKTDAIDLTKILAAEKLAAKAVPIIKDRHVVHHKNMGGASYVYLNRHDQLEDTLSFLRSSKGIDSVHTKQEAVEIFHLHPDRIGDLLVLGNVPVAFGHLKSEREEIKIRSHGSRFESTVPLLAYGTSHQASEFQYNFDVVRRLQL